ncbi:MAG TPA: hypothetical protein VK604_01460 [Bryobacteraceae bacterium]|nr:hypothetical protein [Bryobacteraceae bacterium]
MEPHVQTFLPSRFYATIGWAALAGSAVCLLCAFRAPYAFIPALLCILTAAGLFWLSSRPPICVGETQFTIGERAIAWREVREINRSRFLSPLVLQLKLTNSRSRVLVYPGEPNRIELLLAQLRKRSHLATFDGVPYREYWHWTNWEELQPDTPAEPPTRLFSSEDEAEIERLYHTLKTGGRLDTHTVDTHAVDPHTVDPSPASGAQTPGAKTSGED